MNSEPKPIMDDSNGQIPPQNAIKLFDPSAGASDFPVLKAFQEYLENEQAKSRKRMLGLSIFFIVLLVVVVVTFTLIVTSVINRNQTLSDRLLDVALRERQPVAQPNVVTVQPPAQPVAPQTSDAMKPMVEKLEQLTKAIAEQQKPAPVPPATTPEQAKIVAETQAKLQQQAELKRQQDAVKAEREKLKAEQEKLHKEQVELYQRRRFPEYYARQDALAAEAAARAAQPAPATQTPAPAIQPPVTRPQPLAAQTLPAKGTPAPLPVSAQQPSVPPAVVQPPAPVRVEPPQSAPKKQPAPIVLPEDDHRPIDVNSKKPLTFFKEEAADEDLKALIQQTNAKQKAPQTKPAQSAPAPAKPLPATKPLPAAKQTTPSVPDAVKTETLKVGTANSNSIPWILEAPVAPKAK